MTFTPPPASCTAFVFDCDGTLADTMPLHFGAWKHALKAEGGTFAFTWDVFMSRAGMALEASVIELNAQFGCQLDPARVGTRKRAWFAARQDTVDPVPDVVAFVHQLAGRAPMAVASGSNRAHVEACLVSVGLRQHFDIIVTPADVTSGKPAPDMFLLCAERMGVAPEVCAVFEDAELGLQAARRAGMTPVLVVPPSAASRYP